MRLAVAAPRGGAGRASSEPSGPRTDAMAADRNDDINALRADPTRRLRMLLGPTSGRHVAFMEKVKAHYVVTERDERLKHEIELMIENAVMRRDPAFPHGADNRREGVALAVVAESGAGKTAAMLNYLRDSPFFPNHGVPYGGCPLITVNVQAPTTLAQVGMSTLRATGYATARNLREAQAWAQVHAQIKGQSILAVHFAEAQRIIQQKNVIERGKIVETIAGLLTDTEAPLQIILSGLPPITALFQENFLDDVADYSRVRERHQTLRRRTRFVEFPPIDLKADARDLDRGIRQFEKIAEVSLAVLRGDDDFRARLRHAATGQFGLFFELIVMAIDLCVRERRTVVTKADFQDAYAARTREPAELNPFFVDHWRSIDTNLVQRKADDMETFPKGKPERRRIDNE